MSLAVQLLTIVHVALSLVGIGYGFVVMRGMLRGQRMDRATKIFLITTVATTVTGYFFPVEHLLPSHVVGLVSLLVLALALVARYYCRLAGGCRWLYVIGAVAGQYLDVFVLVVQSFLKVPALNALAPKQQEPPFLVTQLIVLVAFLVFGFFAVKKFHGPEVEAVRRGA